MNKKLGVAALIIAIIALCLSVVNLGISQQPVQQESRDIQYVMYLGTNDKDTNEPVYAPDEAKAKAAEILVRHFGAIQYRRQMAAGKIPERYIRNIPL